MPQVRLTPHLRRFFDLPSQVAAEGSTVAEIVRDLDRQWPGLAFYVTDEHGRQRQHVAIWVNDKRIEDRTGLTDAVPADATITILQALSGG